MQQRPDRQSRGRSPRTGGSQKAAAAMAATKMRPASGGGQLRPAFRYFFFFIFFTFFFFFFRLFFIFIAEPASRERTHSRRNNTRFLFTFLAGPNSCARRIVLFSPPTKLLSLRTQSGSVSGETKVRYRNGKITDG